MAVTVASFRADLPEFGSLSQYPTAVIQYWLSMGALLMGLQSGSPPQVCSLTGSIAGGVLTVTATAFGSLTGFPLLLQGNGIPNSNPPLAIINQASGAPGQAGNYNLNIGVPNPIAAEVMVAVQGGSFVRGNPFWGPSSAVASSPPTTIADFALEMWTAHQIVLEKQALAAAATGGDPGTKIGVISSKSVNGVSVGFDVGSVTSGKMQENAGYYNQTIYGQRFYRMIKMRGAGPIQVGIGINPLPFANFYGFGLLGSYNAWAGPYPGVEQGDTGFSS